MHEILARLAPADRVLDLGSGPGSFPPPRAVRCVVRADMERPPGPVPANFVLCSADALPFRDAAFAAVIANHSVEHFDRLPASLAEAGRAVKTSGWFYAAVPDSSTLTDRLYRWLGKGGGHVNPFDSLERLVETIERHTGLPAAGSRVLHTSLSYLNRKNQRGRMQRKMLLLSGGSETFLHALNWALRALDRAFGSRLSVYGWACYFGAGIEVDQTAWKNVCVRCGSAHPLEELTASRRKLGFDLYRCPRCGTENLLWKK